VQEGEGSQDSHGVTRLLVLPPPAGRQSDQLHILAQYRDGSQLSTHTTWWQLRRLVLEEFSEWAYEVRHPEVPDRVASFINVMEGRDHGEDT